MSTEPGPRGGFTFCFPYFEVSGVPILFRRMAERLAEAHGQPAEVVDYPDGYMGLNLRRASGARLVPYQPGRTVRVPAENTLVLQSLRPYSLWPEIQPAPDTRVIFWTLHPANFLQPVIPHPSSIYWQSRYRLYHRLLTTLVYPGVERELRALAGQMAGRRALWFMDGATYRYVNAWSGARLPAPVYVPVACDAAPRNRRAARPGPGDVLRVAWLGRLADFKISILTHTLRRLSDWAARTGQPVEMHIIGVGPQADDVFRLPVQHAHFQIKAVGRLAGQALDDYLAEHIDLLAAMGASALEGAKLGLPTLLLDFSYGPIPADYVYRWLFDVPDYSLGDVITSAHLRPGNDSLDRALAAVRADYAGLSRRSYEYCQANHSLPVVAERFLAAAAQADFRWRDFSPSILVKGRIMRAYEAARDFAKRVLKKTSKSD